MLDVTNPVRPRPVPNAVVRLAERAGALPGPHLRLRRGGRDGLVIVDIERPETPTLDQIYDAGGAINDAHDVKVGMTNASEFAYVADGKNGLRVVQLTSPEDTPGYSASARGRSPGSSPPPARAVTPWPSPRGSTATGPSTRAATRSPCSAGSAAGRSPCRRCSGSTCATAPSTP